MRTRTTIVGAAAWVIGLALAGGPAVVAASECDDPGAGWLACEDFEAGGLGWTDWYAQSQWTECAGCPDGVNNPNRIRLDNDPALAHDGNWSLTTPGTSANHTGGTLRYASCEGEQNAGCTLEGHDQLYFRTWVRLAQDHDYVHHFLGVGGSRPDAYWDANGNAGCRPNGERWAGTRVDLNSDHELFFYTYYPGMNCDAGGYCSGQYAEDICNGCANIDMACSNGPECCWGDVLRPETPVVVPTETWTCIELMMELNTPGQADGSMTFWVNDTEGHSVEGMEWRDVPELQLNRAMLEHFIDSDDTDHPNQVWFDDVVVSTERIGCSVTPGGSDDDGGPAPADDGGDSTMTAGGGTTDAGADDGTGGGGNSGATNSGADGGADSGSGGADTESGTDPLAADDDDSAGCGCAAGSDRGPLGPLAWASVLLVMVRRRRWRGGLRAHAQAASAVR
ncbi:MAG: hypothetical protein JKY37_02240 [Nannocystaceae bacterium]|nr:hypothetical protein [Nannocystaceae bacterium]